MSENKEGKERFLEHAFRSEEKTSCCCGSQIEIVPEEVKLAETPTCGCGCDCGTTDKGTVVIKVLGTGCSSCKALYSTVQEAVKELGIDATVEKEEDLNKIMAYNVMSLPALVVNEKVVSKGQKLTVEQVKKLLS